MFSSEKTGSRSILCTVRFFFLYIFLHQFRYTTHLFTPEVSFPGGRGKQFSTWPTSEPSETTDIIRFLVGTKKKNRIFVDKTPLLLFQLSCAHLADHNAFHISGNGF